MKLGTTSTILIGTLTLVLVAVGGWLLLLGPTTAAVAERREAADAAAERSRVLAAQLARLQEKAEDLTATRAAQVQLSRLFPATADQPGFFAQVGQVARAAGYAPADITTLSPTAPVVATAEDGETGTTVAPPTPAAPATGTVDPVEAAEAAETAEYAAQTVTLTLEGSYAQAERLLAGLERLDRAVLLRSVSLTGETDSSTLTVALTASIFVAPPLTAPREGPDPTSQPG